MKTYFFKFILALVIALTAVSVISPALMSAAPHDQSGSIRYRVRSGDTLSSLARRYGTSVSAIKRANGMRSSTIYVNQVLTIPRRSTSSVSPSTPSSKSGGNDSGRCGTWYTVKKGDTLSSISRRCGVSVSTIKSLNRLSSNIIRPGQRLRLRGAVSTVKPTKTRPPTPEPPVMVDPPYPTPHYRAVPKQRK